MQWGMSCLIFRFFRFKMLLLNHILVATDFSPTSLVALREALRIASRCGSTVSYRLRRRCLLV